MRWTMSRLIGFPERKSPDEDEDTGDLPRVGRGFGRIRAHARQRGPRRHQPGAYRHGTRFRLSKGNDRQRRERRPNQCEGEKRGRTYRQAAGEPDGRCLRGESRLPDGRADTLYKGFRVFRAGTVSSVQMGNLFILADNIGVTSESGSRTQLTASGNVSVNGFLYSTSELTITPNAQLVTTISPKRGARRCTSAQTARWTAKASSTPATRRR